MPRDGDLRRQSGTAPRYSAGLMGTAKRVDRDELKYRRSANTSCSLTVLGCAPPVIPGSNDWDLIYDLHIEQITIDAD
jgi:hypothetical protein